MHSPWHRAVAVILIERSLCSSRPLTLTHTTAQPEMGVPREWMSWASGSQGVGPGPEASASPGDFFKMQILRPSLDRLSQRLWGWAQQPVI